jgi:hypothetical protein
MEQNTWIGIVIFVLVLILILWYFLVPSVDEVSTPSITATKQSQGTPPDQSNSKLLRESDEVNSMESSSAVNTTQVVVSSHEDSTNSSTAPETVIDMMAPKAPVIADQNMTLDTIYSHVGTIWGQKKVLEVGNINHQGVLKSYDLSFKHKEGGNGSTSAKCMHVYAMVTRGMSTIYTQRLAELPIVTADYQHISASWTPNIQVQYGDKIEIKVLSGSSGCIVWIKDIVVALQIEESQ